MIDSGADSERGSGSTPARASHSPRADAERFDWDRLERAVRALVEEQASLRGQLAHREERIRELEVKLFEANQLRQDTAKRIDELIGQLDQLDDQLAGLESGE